MPDQVATRARSRPLTAAQTAKLADMAARVAAADTGAHKARSEQNRLWARLLGQGVSKAAIAKASDVTPTAILFRLAAPPSRVNRGAGNGKR